MPGIGTIINVAAIIVGGFIGLLFGRFLTEKLQNAVIRALGLCVIFIGGSGALKEMFTVEGGALSTQGTLMTVVCFALGSFLGELADFDRMIEKLGEWLKQKSGSTNEKGFVQGFVAASVTVSVGTMAVVGPMQDVISGDISLLTVKSLLDLIIVIVLTASLGKGCIFSALPVAVIQGTFSLLAKVVEPVLTEAALSNLNLTGSMLIFCIGVNLLFNTKIKVANMLPTILFAVVWAYIPFLNGNGFFA